jgi:hypothetical protein
MGAIGLNTMLVEIENRRDPRPLAVLAWLLVSLKSGLYAEVLGAISHERAVLAHGLAAHEQALVTRLESLAQGVIPTRPNDVKEDTWADRVLGLQPTGVQRPT